MRANAAREVVVHKENARGYLNSGLELLSQAEGGALMIQAYRGKRLWTGAVAILAMGLAGLVMAQVVQERRVEESANVIPQKP